MKLMFRDILQEAVFKRGVTCDIKTYRPGEVIVEEGSVGTEIFLVLRGTVEVYAAVDHLGTPGRTTGIAKLGQDEVFGELSLFEHQPRTASVVAIEDCEIAIMDGKTLEAFMDAHPGLGYWILKGLFAQTIERLRQTNLRSNAITALYLNDCAE